MLAAFALVIRLVPTLNGGGLYGLGNYDDGVYYAAATAVVHGQLPYRDFLFLHPPGITLVLAPFALLGQVSSDPNGFASARLAWMLLGAANAAIVCRILLPLGLVAAAAGGLFYAVFYPAVYTEHTTTLEAPANTALLLAILLVNRSHAHPEAARHRHGMLTVAGVLLGLSAGFKIWGIVVIALVLAWEVVSRGLRATRWLMLGVIAGGTAVYLPFFAQAPIAMWNEVVRDQLGRSSATTSTATRLAYITGLGSYHPAHPSYLLIIVAVFAACLATYLAWLTPQTRVAVVLLLGLSLFLLIVPTWFSHYAGLIAPPAALVAGAAAAPLSARLRMIKSRLRARTLNAVTAAAALAGMCLYAWPLTHSAWGQRFPTQAFARAAHSVPGCVTADDPTALIVSNTLSRNLMRGCRTVVDLGGYSHDMRTARHTTVERLQNQAWQRFSLAYLGSGSAAFVVRFNDGHHFDSNTRAVLSQWPVLVQIKRYMLRSPQP